MYCVVSEDANQKHCKHVTYLGDKNKCKFELTLVRTNDEDRDARQGTMHLTYESN